MTKTNGFQASAKSDERNAAYPNESKAPNDIIVSASLYKAFEPAEAQRILSRLEFCHTPKHGSWLNMAEIELSILSRQCLERRIPDQETLK
jgi:hypothetical protein